MKVRLTQTAEVDLEEIGDFIARCNPARAVTFVQELRRSCLDLGRQPEAYPVVERYAHRSVRRRVHGPYLILYIVAADAVTILHIRNSARDFDNMLFDL